jgi:hypothetical protein
MLMNPGAIPSPAPLTQVFFQDRIISNEAQKRNLMNSKNNAVIRCLATRGEVML